MPPFKDRRPPVKYRDVKHHVRHDHGWLLTAGRNGVEPDFEKAHEQMHEDNPRNPPYGYGPPGHHHGGDH